MPIANPDAVIVGGGIAGLWMLNVLRGKGYDAILLESNELGGTQTLVSQGVLHGGLKYALNGKLTDSSEAIRDMPARWLACLEGDGEIDLSAVQVRATHQVLWSEPGLSSRLTTFFGSKALAGRSEKLSKGDAPEPLQHPDYRGALYRLDEPVLDVLSLVRALAEPWLDAIYCAEVVEVGNGMLRLANDLELKPARTILAGGSGNAGLQVHQEMQRRPLHQVMVAMPSLPSLYSVCMGSGTKPVLVSTTHETADGTPMWYLGGNIAETGVNRSAEEQIMFAQSELARLLPWMDFSAARWGTCCVDRAEPLQADGEKPVGAYCRAFDEVIVTWPTKLVMAPLLGDELLRLMPPPSGDKTGALDLPRAGLASSPWSDF